MTETKYTQVEMRDADNRQSIVFIPSQFAARNKKLKIYGTNWIVINVYKTVDKKYLEEHYQAYREFHDVLEEH
jgi:hypothetical protein